MRLGFKIAKRFLKSNIGQTILIILGIAIGVSVQIFIGSLIQGLQKGLIDKTIGNSSQITVSASENGAQIEGYQDLIKKIKKTDSTITKVAGVSDQVAFIESGNNSNSILMRGLELNKADDIYNIKDRLTEGTYPKDSNEILLGVGLKKEFGLKLNDTVTIITTKKETVSCKVVGFFDLQVASINNSWAISTLDNVQKMFGVGNTVTSIEMQMKTNAVFTADVVAKKIDKKLNDNSLVVDNWKDQNQQLLSGLQGQSVSSAMIQVFVMISVVLGIASVLAITVMQKSKQIGILKAMGIKNSVTSYVFLFEGLLLGFFGAVTGILFGLGLSLAFTKFALNPDGTPVIDLYIDYRFILISGVIAMAASVIAALIPAIKSSKLNPIDIIRNN